MPLRPPQQLYHRPHGCVECSAQHDLQASQSDLERPNLILGLLRVLLPLDTFLLPSPLSFYDQPTQHPHRCECFVRFQAHNTILGTLFQGEVAVVGVVGVGTLVDGGEWGTDSTAWWCGVSPSDEGMAAAAWAARGHRPGGLNIRSLARPRSAAPSKRRQFRPGSHSHLP